MLSKMILIIDDAQVKQKENKQLADGKMIDSINSCDLTCPKNFAQFDCFRNDATELRSLLSFQIIVST